MTALLQQRTRRSLALALALITAVTLLSVVTPRAEAAKPDQIVGADVMGVNQLTCVARIDVDLNTKGSMKNDIEVTVAGTGPGFAVMREAKRGATLRIEESLGGPGLYTGTVGSRNPRTGEVVQTYDLGFITCG
jgi:hypothetical protein